MRKNETEQIEALLEAQGINLITVRAADRYFEALKGVTEPEQNARSSASCSSEFSKTSRKMRGQILGPRHIAPDWIESGGGVETPSNLTTWEVFEDMTLEVVEPLRELYKDEVRELARTLDISVRAATVSWPRFAVRTLGELTPERVAVVREACAIVEEEFEGAERGEMEIPGSILLPSSPSAVSVFTAACVRTAKPSSSVPCSMDGMSPLF